MKDDSSVKDRYHSEAFTSEETEILSTYFTNVDAPVFALKNLPEVVKGALFARYSRTDKSLRRLFLDEFHGNPESAIGAISEAGGVDVDRAEKLYDKVFSGYGDDSVAQLGGCHLACEQVSNIMTKVIERGRLASYLEQSTRYIYYDTKLGDRYRYTIPPELDARPDLRAMLVEHLDDLFGTYRALMPILADHYEKKNPRSPEISEGAWRAAIRAKVCDDLRGLLPAATLSNLGMYGSGQAYENLILRMRAHPLEEVRGYSDMMLSEVRKVIPSFLKRVDVEDRGVMTTKYLADTKANVERFLKNAGLYEKQSLQPCVRLVEYDPIGERKVASAIVATHGTMSFKQADMALFVQENRVIDDLFSAYIGDRTNRRHKPGRAFEHTSYTFEIVADYGVFRDLQRHRLLTIDWQKLTPFLGHYTPTSIIDVGQVDLWFESMDRSTKVYEKLREAFGEDVAQYAIPMAFNVRFHMRMNAREAYHVVELRTGIGGHESYRRICQDMHRLIAEEAKHRRIAGGMVHIDNTTKELGRIASEQRNHEKKNRTNSIDGKEETS